MAEVTLRLAIPRRIKSRLRWAIIVFACVVSPAFAGDPMTALFGNTLTVTGPEGATRLWYKPDHTFTGVDQNRVKIAGAWAYSNGEICTSIRVPAVRPKHCGKLGLHKIGDRWRATRPNGAKVVLSLTAGK